jgi:CheY-like chemotaxis protein
MKIIDKKELLFYAKDRILLVVEDDNINLKIVNNVLEKYFKKIILAKNGQEAFEIFQKEKQIDIIISDIEMPIMNGIILSKKIKAKNDTPILVLSSNEEKETFIELINIGVDKFIPKPLDINLLTSALKNVLEALKHKEFINSLTKFDINNLDKAVKEENQNINPTKYSLKLETKTIKEFLDNLLNSGLKKEEIEGKFNSISIESKILEKILQDIVIFSSDIEYQVSFDTMENSFYEASKRFESIYYKINEFNLLKSLADVFFEFHLFFDSCKSFDNFTNEQILELMDLEFIYTDIRNCIQELFVKNSAENINIYADMLEADLKQLESKIQTETKDSDEYGELDFFD